MTGKSAIEKDFNRSPIIHFKTKANALKAKELATKRGIKTKLYKMKDGYSLRMIK